VSLPDRPLSDAAVTAHYAWRDKVNAHLPAVAARVFALRGVMYRGAGFHYGLESQVGQILHRVNDYNNPVTFLRATMDRVIWKLLLRTLVTAEFSARGWDFPGKRDKRG
jgi:hypothetical protein